MKQLYSAKIFQARSDKLLQLPAGLGVRMRARPLPDAGLLSRDLDFSKRGGEGGWGGWRDRLPW